MAYNKAFNPDALPAHAEPEEAAQAISRLQQRRSSSQTSAMNSHPTPPKNGTGPIVAGRGRISPNHQQQPFRPPHAVNTQNAQQSFVQNRLNSPPPPQNYGYGPRPNIAAQQRPQLQNPPLPPRDHHRRHLMRQTCFPCSALPTLPVRAPCRRRNFHQR
ncbi:hypothetical protein GJ744_009860 [Endocarpon pusillum]|uniref:Uncharacterized protein n=1 Tax=Endocarpon pusillum TaxID=364733 RepID=A0A8H7AF57_9EURO|nr:hypothetical protein GJ744_009860 [Endocarpon pusillum]